MQVILYNPEKAPLEVREPIRTTNEATALAGVPMKALIDDETNAVYAQEKQEGSLRNNNASYHYNQLLDFIAYEKKEPVTLKNHILYGLVIIVSHSLQPSEISMSDDLKKAHDYVNGWLKRNYRDLPTDQIKSFVDWMARVISKRLSYNNTSSTGGNYQAIDLELSIGASTWKNKQAAGSRLF